MSEKLILQDIQRVQDRIARIRQRAGRHASQMTDISVLNTFKNYQALFTPKPDPQPSRSQPLRSTVWWGLLIAIAGWYFSQPQAVQNLWQKLLAYWQAWKNSEDADAEQTVVKAGAEENQPEPSHS